MGTGDGVRHVHGTNMARECDCAIMMSQLHTALLLHTLLRMSVKIIAA